MNYDTKQTRRKVFIVWYKHYDSKSDSMVKTIDGLFETEKEADDYIFYSPFATSHFTVQDEYILKGVIT